MHIYLGQIYFTPIDHTSMEYHYTTEVSHIGECTYSTAPLLLVDHRYMEYHYIKYV